MNLENIRPELREKLTNARSLEEIREIAEAAGCARSDEELCAVSGGIGEH